VNRAIPWRSQCRVRQAPLDGGGNRAKRLLKDGDLPLAQIALAYGSRIRVISPASSGSSPAVLQQRASDNRASTRDRRDMNSAYRLVRVRVHPRNCSTSLCQNCVRCPRETLVQSITYGDVLTEIVAAEVVNSEVR
jgi:hypothetical protein